MLAPQFRGSSSRAAIWADYEAARDTIRQLVPVHAAWIGGSFTTDKLDPGDLDVVWVSTDTLHTLTQQDQDIVGLFAEKDALKIEMGWAIDSFILWWTCRPEPWPSTQLHVDYAHGRGYWDDFWQRKRQSPDGPLYIPADAVPRRGYLEVSFDDYL